MGNNKQRSMCLQKKVSSILKTNKILFFFIYRTETNTFCSDPNNVTGLCNRNSCPLANSRYSTVYEEKGVCYLKMKTAERAHTPKELWESIKLDPSYNKALEQIDTELKYWPNFLKHKCKQRFTRLRQILIKRKKMKLEGRAEYKVVSHKAEKREKTRLVKAEKSALIENHIVDGLLENLKKRKYDDIYNINKEILNKIIETEKPITDNQLEEDFNEDDYYKGYIEDFSDEEEENEDENDGNEDFEDDDDNENDMKKIKNEIDDDEIDDIFKQSKDETKKDKKGKKDKKIGKKRKRNIEYEQEYENVRKNVNYNIVSNNNDNLDDYL